MVLRSFVKGNCLRAALRSARMPATYNSYVSASTCHAPCIWTLLISLSATIMTRVMELDGVETGWRRGGAEAWSSAAERSEADGGPQRQDPVAWTGVQGNHARS